MKFKILPSERRILRLIADGYLTKQIPELTGFTFSTVATKRLRMIRRNGANTMAHLISMAYQNKILK